MIDKNYTGWAKDIRPEKYKWLGFYEGNLLKYGFDSNGNWGDGYSSQTKYFEDPNNRPATDKEVESALIAEAKKEGLKKGFMRFVQKKINRH